MKKLQLIIANIYDYEDEIEKIEKEISPCYLEKARKNKKQKDKLQEIVSGYLLKQYLGVMKDNQISYNDYGKPMLETGNLFFNLSHSNECVVLGIAECELGVDIEKIRKCHEATVKKVFREEEKEKLKGLRGIDRDKKFTEIWTQYESVLKCKGIGFHHGWSNIPLEFYYVKMVFHDGYYISCATEENMQIEIIIATYKNR